MITKQEIKENSKYEEEILELIDNQDNYTRSDIQAIVAGIVIRIRKSTTL